MRDRIKLALLALFFVALVIAYVAWGDLLSLETIKLHRAELVVYSREHYVLSAATFIIVLVLTAFFIPGAIVMSLLGGFLFGMPTAVVYIDAGMTLGAVLAFLAARYVFGNWLQKRFAAQMKVLNAEIKKHGPSYLTVLRIIPIMPFFAVNYLAGLTKMSLFRFTVSTMIGILPGAFIYSYAGEQLANIESVKGLMSSRMIIAVIAMAILTLLPVIVSHLKRLAKWQ